MRKYHCITILLTLIVVIMPYSVSIDSEYIERDEIPKDLGLNVLRIYNYHNESLLFFDGYHQKGVIYLGDFKDIEHLYDYSTLDFILVQKNTSESFSPDLLLTPELSNVELQDEDNSIVVIDENTLLLELKRFKFIISSKLLAMEDIIDYDAQFFILNSSKDIIDIKNTFSVEQIFLVGDFPEENGSIISIIPKSYYVQFVCNQTSYKYEYRSY